MRRQSPLARLRSLGFMPAALNLMSTWFGPGVQATRISGETAERFS